MPGIQLPNNDINTDFALFEQWKPEQDANHRIIDARLFGHWAIDYAMSDEGVDTLGYRGGVVISAAGAVSIAADGTVLLTDNATNYVERTLAGVVSANASSFTAGRLPMYKVVVTAHVFTAITDLRQFAAQLEASLLAIAQLTPAADRYAYFTSATAAALGTITAFARTLLDDADAATMLATLGAASTAYVDTLIAGFSHKDAVRVATTAAINLATDLENGDTIDGVVLATGDRVLVKNQAAPEENGIYVVPAAGAASRATDADSWTDLLSSFVAVQEGTTNADTMYLATQNAGGTLGVTAVTFSQFGGGAPAAHATSHQSGGGDAIKLDDLAAPDDNTDLNATSSAHGLTKKLGAAGTALVSDGTNQQWGWAPESFTIAISDETTALTTGTAKVTFRAPYAVTLTAIPRASLNTVSSSGVPTFDINKSGATILTDKLTIDASEKTSTTAATAATFTSSPMSFTDDEEITIDIDVAGTGAKGAKITFYWQRTA